MRLFQCLLLSVLLSLTTAVHAFAEKREVPANKSSVMLYSVVYDPETCATGGKPRTKINTEPMHGSIRFQWFAYKMSKGAYHCNGKLAHGMLVVYTPNKGYHGTDKVTFSLIGSGVYPGAAYELSKTYWYDITVK